MACNHRGRQQLGQIRRIDTSMAYTLLLVITALSPSVHATMPRRFGRGLAQTGQHLQCSQDMTVDCDIITDYNYITKGLVYAGGFIFTTNYYGEVRRCDAKSHLSCIKIFHQLTRSNVIGKPGGGPMAVRDDTTIIATSQNEMVRLHQLWTHLQQL
jgi:hypothetical protein